MDFKRYQKVKRFGTEDVQHIGLGTCYMFPKIDGCFDYKTKILLADGSYEEIGKIVNQKKNLEVLSFDKKTGKVVTNKIINWYKKISDKNEWLTIEVYRATGGLKRGGGRNRQLLCTKNHNFITDINNWKETQAEDLIEGQFVYLPQFIPTDIQKQVILGTLLGDGCAFPNRRKVYCNGISFCHSIKQKDYLEFKCKLLGNLYKSKRIRISGFRSQVIDVNTKCNKITQILYEQCYNNFKKEVNLKWLRSLNSLGLAIWYMDDGTLSGNRVKFSVEGFNKKETNIILKYFRENGYDCYLQEDAKNHTIIVFSPEGTKNLFFDISPYVIKSMEYKILPEFRGNYIDFSYFIGLEQSIGLIKRKIKKISKGKKECYFKQGMFKYDIEIENSHTYFADNVLVHNSNASVWFDGTEIKAGSRNRVLTLENDNAGFFKAVLEEPQFDGLKKCLKENPNLRFYGEWLVPHSLKDYREDAWRKFYVFDVTEEFEKCDCDNSYSVPHDNDKMCVSCGKYCGVLDFRYLPYEEYKEICDEYRIEYIPCMKKIKNPTYEDIIFTAEQNHYLLPEDKVGEGVVIKNYQFVNKFGRTQWAKVVLSEFKEKHYKEMGCPEKENKMVEEEIVEKFCTKAFVDKTHAKIVNQKDGWRSEYIPYLLSLCYRELLEEEIWNIVKKFKNPVINFKTLKAFTVQKIKQCKPEVF